MINTELIRQKVGKFKEKCKSLGDKAVIKRAKFFYDDYVRQYDMVLYFIESLPKEE